ncbi:MAG: major outer membrane protein, partial [Arcobacteraceae bacterium]
MQKFAKISLAAAVAVAGLSSVASAKPLEEAIKGVDATGYVTYQYNDRSSKTDGVNNPDS